MELIGSLLSFVFVLAVLAVVGGAVVLLRPYNHLRASRELVEKAVSDINNALQHQESLESQMNQICEQYGAQELLAMGQAAGADARMTPRMGRAYVSCARDYPELKADKTYNRLADDHNKWGAELLGQRDRYNDYAMQYNNVRTSFPIVLIVDRLGFERAPYFDKIAGAGDSNTAEVFKTDTGALLRENLSDVGQLVGKKSRQIAAEVSERSVRIALYGKSRIGSTRGRGEKQGDAGGDDPDPRP